MQQSASKVGGIGPRRGGVHPKPNRVVRPQIHRMHRAPAPESRGPEDMDRVRDDLAGSPIERNPGEPVARLRRRRRHDLDRARVLVPPDRVGGGWPAGGAKPPRDPEFVETESALGMFPRAGADDGDAPLLGSGEDLRQRRRGAGEGMKLPTPRDPESGSRWTAPSRDLPRRTPTAGRSTPRDSFSSSTPPPTGAARHPADPPDRHPAGPGAPAAGHSPRASPAVSGENRPPPPPRGWSTRR
jgi:hypothetical protein